MSACTYIVSSCLCGIPCRYNGRAQREERFVRLVESGVALAVCPEILGGLSVPRLPCEIVRGRVIDAEGRDRSAEFRLGAERTLALASEHGVRVAILKERSPSCGVTQIYDGSFTGIIVPGRGITADLLMRHGLAVYSEENASDDLVLRNY